MRTSKEHLKRHNPLLRRKMLLYIPMATPSSFIVIYNVELSTTMRIITSILSRNWKANGPRSSLQLEPIRYSLNFSAWMVLKNSWSSNCINCYWSVRFLVNFLRFLDTCMCMCMCMCMCCDNTISDNLALRNRSVNIGRLFVKANSRVCLWSIDLWLLKHLHWTKKSGESRPRTGMTTTKNPRGVWWCRDDEESENLGFRVGNPHW